jgi:nitronate monooxygenase
MSDLLRRLGMEHPIIQAPMAGTSTPAMAAAVSNAGGLGSLGVASLGADGARQMIAETQALTNRSINVNLFCHQTFAPDPQRDARWIETMRGEFAKFGAEPPTALRDIYKSFLVDDEMLEVLLALRCFPPPPIWTKRVPPKQRAWMRWWRRASKRAAIAACSIPQQATIS